MAIDSTVAGATADSYLSVADADAFAAAGFGPEVDAWRALNNATPADLEKKERALKEATAMIDASLRTGWRRYAATIAVAYRQALIFPREIDQRGTPTAPFIPANIRRATFAQAKYLLRNKPVIENARMRQSRDLQGASEPNVSYTERPEDAPRSLLSEEAELYLRGFRHAGNPRRLRSARLARGFV